MPGLGGYGYNDPAHAHAVTHIDGVRKYWYGENGNMTTRVLTNTYQFTYDAENRIVQVSGDAEVEFVYDGDGKMVKKTAGAVTTVYVSDYYEHVISRTETITRAYYFVGSQRVAMRQDGTLYYLLTDHLSSTSITTDASGAKIAELRYGPWGEIRYAWGSQVTDYTYTGQRSEVRSFGLMYYRARWYDPSLGRFAQADTLIPNPGNVLDWDRYQYVRSNPIRFIDPTGYFTEDAIREYLERVHGQRFAQVILEMWKADAQWWAMLQRTQAGDVLYGQGWLYPQSGGMPSGAFPVVFQFSGEGHTYLGGITPSGETAGIPGFQNVTLVQIQAGTWETRSDQVVMEWRGVVRLGENPISTARLVYTRYQDSLAVVPMHERIQEGAYVTIRLIVTGGIALLPIESALVKIMTAAYLEVSDLSHLIGQGAASLVPNFNSSTCFIILGPVEFSIPLNKEVNHAP